MPGWVYVITNDSLPDLVKIGFTTRHPRERAKELRGTNVPGSYVVEFAALVEQPRNLESDVHKQLSGLGLSVDKEWFRCDVGMAVWSIRENAPGEIREWYSDEAEEARIEAEVQQALHRKRLADRKQYEDDQRRKNEKQEISQCLEGLRKKNRTISAEVAGKNPVVFDYRSKLEAFKLHIKVLIGLCAVFCLYFALGLGLASGREGGPDSWDELFAGGLFFGSASYLLAVVTGGISSWHRKRAKRVEARQQELLLPVNRLFPHLDRTIASYLDGIDQGKRPSFLAPIPAHLQSSIGGKAHLTGGQFSGVLSNSTQDWVITLAVLRIPLHYDPCSFRLPICVFPGEEEEFELSAESTEGDSERDEDFSWNIHQVYGYIIP